MNEKYELTQLDASTPDHIVRQLATLHCEQIADGFLTKLGPRFLRRLYREMVASPHALVIAVLTPDSIAGFICGSTNTASVYKTFLRRQAIWALPAALPTLIRPENLRRTWETWRYPSRSTNTQLPDAEILNFCVSGQHQRQGLGRRLFKALVSEFGQRQVPAIKIVTGGRQQSAHSFYESVGAELVDRIEVHRGDTSLVYKYVVPSNQLAGHSPHTPHSSAA